MAAFATWRATASRQLADLLAVDLGRTDGEVIFSAGTADQSDQQLIMLSTDDDTIPCWLLTPPSDRRVDAAVVAVAGHGRGIDDLVTPAPDADDFHGGLARKLAAAGFTVLCPEMVSFGRRRTPMPESVPPTPNSCQVDAMRGILTGRPVLGRRVADTLAAGRALGKITGVDPTKIAVVGASGGGAVALLAAALDDQLSATVVGTYLSSYVDSLGTVPHCICNAVPHLLTWFEMADLAAMVAPRELIIEAGRRDPIFPITATRRAYAQLQQVWQGLGATSLELVVTDAGHQFVADESIAHLRRLFSRA
ncbi:MAG TPA: dienelactone hydrolase family protein [Microlunatus sp.]|nr:dienelactone hydrolase family protein [Microlunatus sp.]